MLWIPDIRPAKANLVKRQYFKVPGNIAGVAVPSGAKVLRALAMGCGGQGANNGGSGAFARRKITVSPSDTFSLQIGLNSTGNTPGDSAIWRGAAGTEIIVYADRGRGNGNPGLAINSVGDITRDGVSGLIDTNASYEPGDSLDLQALGFEGLAPSYHSRSGDPGAGGGLVAIYSSTGTFLGYAANPAGQGLACMEWWDADPGY